MESPKIKLSIHGQPILDKGAKNTQWRKDSLFNKWCWNNWILTCKIMKLDPYCTSLTKINLNWIKDLNVRPQTMKLLEENIWTKLLDIGFGNDFLDTTPETQATKSKINAWDYIKLKSFCTAKETTNKVKRQRYIYTIEYYSAIKKEWNNAICQNMDAPRDYHTK